MSTPAAWQQTNLQFLRRRRQLWELLFGLFELSCCHRDELFTGRAVIKWGRQSCGQAHLTTENNLLATQRKGCSWFTMALAAQWHQEAVAKSRGQVRGCDDHCVWAHCVEQVHHLWTISGKKKVVSISLGRMLLEQWCSQCSYLYSIFFCADVLACQQSKSTRRVTEWGSDMLPLTEPIGGATNKQCERGDRFIYFLYI